LKYNSFYFSLPAAAMERALSPAAAAANPFRPSAPAWNEIA
jgi:hypothetical protein